MAFAALFDLLSVKQGQEQRQQAFEEQPAPATPARQRMSSGAAD